MDDCSLAFVDNAIMQQRSARANIRQQFARCCCDVSAGRMRYNASDAQAISYAQQGHNRANRAIRPTGLEGDPPGKAFWVNVNNARMRS